MSGKQHVSRAHEQRIEAERIAAQDAYLAEENLTGQEILLGRIKKPATSLGFASKLDNAHQPTEMVTSQDESHIITFGPTGTGKGVSAIVPNLLHYRGGAVVLDLKNGELTKITARRRREMGQQVYVLDPFGITGEKTACINPLEIFRLEGSNLEADAEMLADIFSQGNKGVKDPFWDLHGCGLLAAIIAYAVTMTEQRNISKIMDTLMSDDTVYNLAVVLDTIGKKLNKMSYREIASFLQMPDITRGGVQATTLSYLKTFHSPSMLATLDETTVPLDDFINGKPMTIYIVFPVDRIKSHRAYLKLMMGLMLKLIVSRKSKPETKTLLVFDECGQLGNFPFLEMFITLCRSFGCRVWTLWQDLAQLKSSYGESWNTILNNCGIVQTFGILNRNLAHQWGDFFDSSPADIRQMPADHQLLMMHGRGEVKAQRLNYLEDTMFAGMFDKNPMYHAGKQTTLKPVIKIPKEDDKKEDDESSGKSNKRGSSGDTGGIGMRV
jgi:type IV secretion system protein VirD4